jgi:hypothetical protein
MVKTRASRQWFDKLTTNGMWFGTLTMNGMWFGTLTTNGDVVRHAPHDRLLRVWLLFLRSR